VCSASYPLWDGKWLGQLMGGELRCRSKCSQWMAIGHIMCGSIINLRDCKALLARSLLMYAALSQVPRPLQYYYTNGAHCDEEIYSQAEKFYSQMTCLQWSTLTNGFCSESIVTHRLLTRAEDISTLIRFWRTFHVTVLSFSLAASTMTVK